jgi:chromosome segregation ATPase
MESKYLKYQLRLLGLKLAKLKLNIVQSGGSVAQTLDSSSNKIDDILHKLRLEHAAISIRMRNTNDIHAENKARIDAQIQNYEEIITKYEDEITQKDELIAINEQYRKEAQEKFEKLLTQLNEFKREKDYIKELLTEIGKAIEQIEQGGDQERVELEKQAEEHQTKINALEDQVTQLLEEISQLSIANSAVAQSLQPNATASRQQAAVGGQHGGADDLLPPPPPPQQPLPPPLPESEQSVSVPRKISPSKLLTLLNESISGLEEKLKTMNTDNPIITPRYNEIIGEITTISQNIQRLKIDREETIKSSEERINNLIREGEESIKKAQQLIKEDNTKRLETIDARNADIRNTTAVNEETATQKASLPVDAAARATEIINEQTSMDEVDPTYAEDRAKARVDALEKVREDTIEESKKRSEEELSKLERGGFRIRIPNEEVDDTGKRLEDKCYIRFNKNDEKNIDSTTGLIQTTKIQTTSNVDEAAVFKICDQNNCEGLESTSDKLDRTIFTTTSDGTKVYVYIATSKVRKYAYYTKTLDKENIRLIQSPVPIYYYLNNTKNEYILYTKGKCNITLPPVEKLDTSDAVLSNQTELGDSWIIEAAN